MQDFYTVPKAATLLGVSKPTAYKWLKLKRISAIEIGGILFITYADIQLKRIKKCTTCYHQKNGHCSCREIADVLNPCSDWYPYELRD